MTLGDNLNAERAAVVVIDRESGTRDLLTRLVMQAGFTAMEAADTDEAVGLLGQNLALIAIVPVETETRLVETARRLRSGRGDLQLIVHARGASARMVRDAIRAGAVDFYDVAAETPEAFAGALRRARERYTADTVRGQLVQIARAISEEALRALVHAERRELELEALTEGEQEMDYRALVVDHDDDARNLLDELLTLEGCEVQQARSAPDVVAAMEELQFDLIVAERLLPGADGLMLLQDVRKSAPQVETILLVTNGAAEISTPLSELGVGAIFAKPFIDPHDIASQLRFVLQGHRRSLRAHRQLARIKERNHEFLSKLQGFRDSLARLDAGA